MLKATPPLRVAILSSHRAPGLAEILHSAARGTTYDVVGVMTSEDSFVDAPLCRTERVVLAHRSVRGFHADHKRPLSDRCAREMFDRELVHLLASWRADVVLCCGYLYFLTEPLLNHWPHRVFNIHHSDMLDRTAGGRVRFPGLHAVRDAVFDGAGETRSTVHIVTTELDQGPALLRSWPFPLAPMVEDARRWGATRLLKAYAFAHQEWMLASSWGPLMRETLRFIAQHRSSLGQKELPGMPWELAENGTLYSLAVREATVA